MPCCPAAGADAYYYNSSTDYTFLLNSSFQGFAAAEQSCKDSGGHLASFESEAEQAEVGCPAHNATTALVTSTLQSFRSWCHMLLS